MKGIDVNRLPKNDDIKIDDVNNDVINTMKKVEILYSISKYLIEYRKEHNLTQSQMAKKLGVDQSMIVKLESGKYNPTFKKLYDITEKLTNSSEMYIDILEEIQSNIRMMDSITYDINIITSNIIDYVDFKKIRDLYKKSKNEEYIINEQFVIKEGIKENEIIKVSNA